MQEIKKSSKEVEIDKINNAITRLVYNKIKLKKAYNYYHGYRDVEQFRHIEENYGIGVPTSITFTPLIKKHIDVLIGEYLGLEPDLKISCKDSKTITKIMRDKQLKINLEIFNYLKSYLNNNIISILLENKEALNDPYLEKELIKLKIDLDQNFVSEYEIAAQNILTYFKQSRHIDLKNKMRDLFSDLLISGTCYYRVKPNNDKTNVVLEILNPLHTFVEKNPNSYYLKDSRRVVIRKYMTSENILNEFRDYLTQESIKIIIDKENDTSNDSPSVFVRGVSSSEISGVEMSQSPGILGGLEAFPMLPSDDFYGYDRRHDLIEVYEVEWIESDKQGKLTRHEGIKIGSDVYIVKGESENVVRSINDPKYCTLSINGMFFLDKNGNPFSLMDATMNLQDKYDLLLFYRDNLIASSGTQGDWIDIAFIPVALGVELPDRLKKWAAYKKNGLALIDSSQEGQQMNTTFGGFDDTVKTQSIQAIQVAIESVEQQVSSITGVFREKLGMIEQRDAVTNVQVGIKQSTLLTKQYFDTMDTMYKEVNYDMLNLSKLVFSNGLTGTLILGEKQNKIFTAIPKHYTSTDFDIHIEDSTATFKDRETIKVLSADLIKGGLADPEMIVNIVTSKSLTSLKQYVHNSMKAKKEENNTLSQMQQQIQQYEQELKNMQSEFNKVNDQNNKLNKELEKVNSEKMNIEKKRLLLDQQKVENQKDFNDKTLETKKLQVQIEMDQTYDNNPYNDKIKTVI